jgi:hypothetical protein
MRLSEKYGVSEAVIKAMIKDGWLSCSVPTYEEVIIHYREERKKGVPSRQAITNICEKSGLSERQIYNIIHKFD